MTSLERLIEDILCRGPLFLDGIHANFPMAELMSAVTDWSSRLERDFAEVLAGVEPCIRQSILMSLIPAKAVDPSYTDSYDAAIQEHLESLGLSVSANGQSVLRDICINIRKLQGLSARQARNASHSLAQLRGNPRKYDQILARQSGRCIWCGVELGGPGIVTTLEHVVPKHLGDDLPGGRNWALACLSCNQGKGSALAWSATPWAHDQVERNQFIGAEHATLVHRWVVLRRTGRCQFCSCPPSTAELWVFKRVASGLPIPANCSAACSRCLVDRAVIALRVRWADAERDRASA